ncbi:GNAT family N-acetyltransferase [Saccharopolyspora hirsuta]|nr:GNAT family N-acetyltransferase [Saccharopolyspora hirsuta]
MLDEAVAWLVANGRSGQWGSSPWSESQKRREHIAEMVGGGTTWIAEVDGRAAGAMTLSSDPHPYVPPVDEPELYISLLVSSRAYAGMGVGSGLLAHAQQEAERLGVGLLRVDCYAGGEGRLVDYYRRNGFTATTPLTVGDWPGQLLERRI